MEDIAIINNNYSKKAEKLGQLPQEWLNLIYKESWFKLFVPKNLNGLGCTLPNGLKIQENLANKDGSLGWTITLCAGAAWFVGFLDRALAKEVFSDPKVCLAGSGFVGGTANLVGDKYQISGNWTYASGALHATHLTANCEMLKDGQHVFDSKGEKQIKAFILKREEVEILDGWHYMGMVATGSHAFKVHNLEVPINRCFEILPEKTTLEDPVFKYPFLQLAETTLVANVLGISLHFMDLVSACFEERNKVRKHDQQHLTYFKELKYKQQQNILNAKAAFYAIVDRSWEELVQNSIISLQTLKMVSKCSRDLAQICREATSKLHPFAGLEAAKNHTEINRVWRDLNTVSQHALLIFPF
ncbi:acyl-CoA dehydrogenase [Pedobacter sp. SD-b]|uniref:Acyl-CoA dehydrogenase n=1 Tax=Pedobacter segetis TaxID=2793069 RepID=A0ABS1BJG9_9SPHI|nr:acyl-CoA dehydrogenase [Pedobacter segetis]MBK0383010.1 acyl-CoA dehydrogenase [Pedobacter segetis]